MPTRKKALKNTSEEYARILDIVQRYAIQNTGVAFSVKKHGSSNTDVCTQSTFKTIDCIRAIFGSSLAKELLPYNHQDATWEFKATGLISNANFNAKKLSLLLFINNRSVECSPLKRAIETVYATYLPKGSHPFIYLSLDIKSQNVDVNVHPTKKEVYMGD